MKKIAAAVLALVASHAVANVGPSTDRDACSRIANYAAEVADERDRGISLQDQLFSNQEDGLQELNSYVEMIYSQPGKTSLEWKLTARAQCEAWQSSLRYRSQL